MLHLQHHLALLHAPSRDNDRIGSSDLLDSGGWAPRSLQVHHQWCTGGQRGAHPWDHNDGPPGHFHKSCNQQPTNRSTQMPKPNMRLAPRPNRTNHQRAFHTSFDKRKQTRSTEIQTKHFPPPSLHPSSSSTQTHPSPHIWNTPSFSPLAGSLESGSSAPNATNFFSGGSHNNHAAAVHARVWTPVGTGLSTPRDGAIMARPKLAGRQRRLTGHKYLCNKLSLRDVSSYKFFLWRKGPSPLHAVVINASGSGRREKGSEYMMAHTGPRELDGHPLGGCGSGFGLVPGYTTLSVRVRANM